MALRHTSGTRPSRCVRSGTESSRHKAERVEGVVNLSGRDKFAAVPIRASLDDAARLLLSTNVHRTAVIAKRGDNVCIEGIITQVGGMHQAGAKRRFSLCGGEGEAACAPILP